MDSDSVNLCTWCIRSQNLSCISNIGHYRNRQSAAGSDPADDAPKKHQLTKRYRDAIKAILFWWKAFGDVLDFLSGYLWQPSFSTRIWRIRIRNRLPYKRQMSNLTGQSRNIEKSCSFNGRLMHAECRDNENQARESWKTEAEHPRYQAYKCETVG